MNCFVGAMRLITAFLFMLAIPLTAGLPHRLEVLKERKDTKISGSLRLVYLEYTEALLNVQTALVSSNRFADANKVQSEYHQNLEYLTYLKEGSYQFVFSSLKTLPSEAKIFRDTRNSKTEIILRREITNYISELNKAQVFYVSKRDLVGARKATDEMSLATLELSKLESRNAESEQDLNNLGSPESTAGAKISVQSDNKIKIYPLRKGSHRLYDSKPLRVIENHSKDLSGWQFTSIPQRLVISLRVKVLESGFVYCFAPNHPNKTPAGKVKNIFKTDSNNWRNSKDAIQGKNVHLCYKKFFNTGEFFELNGFEIQIAAKSIIFQ